MKTGICRIQNVGEFLEAIKSIVTHPDACEHWFRGHSNADWKLVPSVYRESPKGELYLTTHFRLSAPTKYENCPPPEDFASWICLMQHYGLPTRLLDWSESPLSAAYFAIIHEPMNTDAAVWCLSPLLLNEHTTGRKSIAILGHSRTKPLLDRAFLGGSSLKKAIAVVGQETNPRISAQQGVFTIHGNATPLEAQFRYRHFLNKFVIPNRYRETFRQELFLLGVRRSILFPDIDNLARELKNGWKRKFGKQ